MQLHGSGLRQQRTIVRYQSQQEALRFISKILKDERGVALLHGPESSGKSVIANLLVRQIQGNVAVALVDGTRTKTPDLLSTILEQFGYDVALDTIEEMLSMLTVFLVQQTRTHQAPVLILENINRMYPSALGAVCKLASLVANGRFALRLVLVSNRNIERSRPRVGSARLRGAHLGGVGLSGCSLSGCSLSRVRLGGARG